MKTITFIFNKQKINIELIRTNNKNMYLKIINNKIVVTASKKYNEKIIKEFVFKHIEKFIQYLKNKKELYSIEEKFIYIDGVKYHLNLLISNKESFFIQNNEVIINSKKGTQKEIIKIIKALLKQQLLNYLKKRMLFFEEKMNLSSHDIKVIYKKTNWGSNFIGKNKISFSSKLAHLNNEVKDYLIVHELAHSIEPNHSKFFWTIVKKYICNYANIQKELKMY